MPKAQPIAVAFWICLSVSGCGKPATTSETNNTHNRFAAPPAKGEEEPPTVLFQLKPSSGRPDLPNAKLYECTYTARARTARFLIELSYGALQGDIPMAAAQGKFLSVQGSDNASLIEDLKLALGAKRTPTNVKKLSDLPFDAVVLGEKLSRDSAGGLSSKPPGDWITTKIFLPKGGDDGEVFLHLNPILGQGEFSIKDADYGDFVLQELAKVL